MHAVNAHGENFLLTFLVVIMTNPKIIVLVCHEKIPLIDQLPATAVHIEVLVETAIPQLAFLRAKTPATHTRAPCAWTMNKSMASPRQFPLTEAALRPRVY